MDNSMSSAFPRGIPRNQANTAPVLQLSQVRQSSMPSMPNVSLSPPTLLGLKAEDVAPPGLKVLEQNTQSAAFGVAFPQDFEKIEFQTKLKRSSQEVLGFQNAGATQNEAFYLRNLEPNSEYYIRARARVVVSGKAGATAWSEPISFRTLKQFVFIAQMIKSHNSILEYNVKMRQKIRGERNQPPVRRGAAEHSAAGEV